MKGRINNMSYELAFALTLLGALALISGIIVAAVVLPARYVENKIEHDYPQYVRVKARMINCANANALYYHNKIRPYEKQIEELETSLRWLPKDEREKVIEEIETLKQKRYVFQLHYDNGLEEVEKYREQMEAIRTANPWLAEHT
jgi:predicted RNase H-like nuclease (RuvC/YqgF family)